MQTGIRRTDADLSERGGLLRRSVLFTGTERCYRRHSVQRIFGLSLIQILYDIHIIVPPHLATTDVYTIKFKQKAPIKEIMNIVTKTIGNIDYKVEDENILLIYSPLNKKGGR